MDSQNFKNLNESYLQIYERKNDDPKGIANKAGVNKPDAWGAPTEFGKEAKRNSLARGIKGVRKLEGKGVRINRHHRKNHLAHEVHKGWAKTAETSKNQTPEQKERRSKLINKDLGSFRKNLSTAERKKDVPFVKQAERASKGEGEFKKEDYDLIIGLLIDEGYVNNEVSADVFLKHMSDEWFNMFYERSIDDGKTDEQKIERRNERHQPAANRERWDDDKTVNMSRLKKHKYLRGMSKTPGEKVFQNSPLKMKISSMQSKKAGKTNPYHD